MTRHLESGPMCHTAKGMDGPELTDSGPLCRNENVNQMPMPKQPFWQLATHIYFGGGNDKS